MPKRPLSTDRAPAPTGPYSQAIAGGGFVFLAGQGPTAPDGTPIDGSFEEQARQTFANLRALAEAAGGSLADAVRVGVYLHDMADFATMNEVYREFFPEPLPARTTIQSDLPGFAVEADAILLVQE
jgi:2-iminobutanoate/2-iminopropanoate deaminase